MKTMIPLGIIYVEGFIDSTIRKYEEFGIPMREQFLRCAEPQLKADMERKIGIVITKKNYVGFSSFNPDPQFKKGEISQFEQYLYVNHNWHLVTVKWKSKSGRIYDVSDSDIACDDIVIWVEGLDVPLIHKHLFPNESLPFQLKDLSYELVVTRMKMDCMIEFEYKEGQDVNQVISQIDTFINEFNEKSEAKDRQYGVVHNWHKQVTGTGKLVYELDLGSTGVAFLKKLLTYFSAMGAFERIELC